MIKICGKVKARYKGNYTDRNGEIHEKIVYSISDDDGMVQRVTDFQCNNKPYCIDEDIEIPVRISCYIKDGGANYTLSINNGSTNGNLVAF